MCVFAVESDGIECEHISQERLAYTFHTGILAKGAESDGVYFDADAAQAVDEQFAGRCGGAGGDYKHAFETYCSVKRLGYVLVAFGVLGVGGVSDEVLAFLAFGCAGAVVGCAQVDFVFMLRACHEGAEYCARQYHAAGVVAEVDDEFVDAFCLELVEDVDHLLVICHIEAHMEEVAYLFAGRRGGDRCLVDGGIGVG